MSAMYSECPTLPSNRIGVDASCPGGPPEKSAAATLVEVAVTLSNARLTASIPGLCARCRSSRNPQKSTAMLPDVSCSEQCEQTFIRTALASVTVEDGSTRFLTRGNQAVFERQSDEVFYSGTGKSRFHWHGRNGKPSCWTLA